MEKVKVVDKKKAEVGKKNVISGLIREHRVVEGPRRKHYGPVPGR